VGRAVASALPPGSDVSTVLNFLRKNKIDHDEYQADTRQVRGIIRTHPRGWLQFEGCIELRFQFNSRRKLLGTDVEEEWIAW
jgi:hypothetical protein